MQQDAHKGSVNYPGCATCPLNTTAALRLGLPTWNFLTLNKSNLFETTPQTTLYPTHTEIHGSGRVINPLTSSAKHFLN